jgi:hypothetical protein
LQRTRGGSENSREFLLRAATVATDKYATILCDALKPKTTEKFRTDYDNYGDTVRSEVSWVQRYAPELNKRCRRELKPTNGSWRVDETYICQSGSWRYLYRAVDSTGATIDFWFSAEYH